MDNKLIILIFGLFIIYFLCRKNVMKGGDDHTETTESQDMTVETTESQDMAVETTESQDMAVETNQVQDMAVETNQVQDMTVETNQVQNMPVENNESQNKLLENMSVSELEKMLQKKKIKKELDNMPSVHSSMSNYDLYLSVKENERKKMYSRIKNGTYWADEILKLNGNMDDYNKIMNEEVFNREIKYLNIKQIYDIKNRLKKQNVIEKKEDNQKEIEEEENQKEIEEEENKIEQQAKIMENKIKIEEEIKKGHNDKFKLLNNGNICQNEMDFNIELNEIECKEMSKKFGFEPMTLNITTPSNKCVVSNIDNKNYVFFNKNKDTVKMSNKYKEICKLSNKSNIK